MPSGDAGGPPVDLVGLIIGQPKIGVEFVKAALINAAVDRSRYDHV